LDQQVKLRGFRIEPGEVEAALAEYASIQECLVTVLADESGDKRLVAYLVGREQQTFSPSELRAFLKKKLPEYMIPSAFVVLEQMPFMPNGKVDRRALPSPLQKRPELEKGYVAPRTPTEEFLAGIWAQALGVERVGIHDNFFELGGHSILATKIISRIQETFQVALPVGSIFELPTIAGLAASLTQALRSGEKLSAPPIARIARDGDSI
jgi:acyl carrier protein